MRLLTVKEIAEKLQVSEAQIYRMVKKGTIPFVEIGGVYRFEPDTINAWIANGGTGGKDE